MDQGVRNLRNLLSERKIEDPYHNKSASLIVYRLIPSFSSPLLYTPHTPTHHTQQPHTVDFSSVISSVKPLSIRVYACGSLLLTQLDMADFLGHMTSSSSHVASSTTLYKHTSLLLHLLSCPIFLDIEAHDTVFTPFQGCKSMNDMHLFKRISHGSMCFHMLPPSFWILVLRPAVNFCYLEGIHVVKPFYYLGRLASSLSFMLDSK
ncbi:Uncharacterized protein Fot_19755 [Forsythia ovata]|uniref:Uncharacterized protein n=1 Tax=Forsythia ovata TaxID=205694 RepID=A0ABD1VLY0_9LAMI